MIIKKETRFDIGEIVYATYPEGLVVYEGKVVSIEYEYSIVEKEDKKEFSSLVYMVKVYKARLLDVKESNLFESFEDAKASMDNDIKLVGLAPLSEEEK